MQATRVRALVREDPTCRGATKPVRHSYWSPVLLNKRSHRNEKPAHRKEDADPANPNFNNPRCKDDCSFGPNTGHVGCEPLPLGSHICNFCK
ncbi:hypothetical protein J1605_009436 [Eschrichtius robustus]|uniref:Uncharacterized protein n=1 Tax=Eschrichtius robustus TaxID=9764 RepID=A0AB34GU47_ESCRO|nr:hypothetical protein J1605_009436 [Eschrichtius robustus]